MMLCKILLLVLGSGLHISSTKRLSAPPSVDKDFPIAGGNKTTDASGVVCIVIFTNTTKLSTKRQLELGLT